MALGSKVCAEDLSVAMRLFVFCLTGFGPDQRPSSTLAVPMVCEMNLLQLLQHIARVRQVQTLYPLALSLSQTASLAVPPTPALPSGRVMAAFAWRVKNIMHPA